MAFLDLHWNGFQPYLLKLIKDKQVELIKGIKTIPIEIQT